MNKRPLLRSGRVLFWDHIGQLLLFLFRLLEIFGGCICFRAVFLHIFLICGSNLCLLQSNLSIADILYSGHLVIVDIVSRKLPNPGQALLGNPLYSGHYFKELRDHLPWSLPLYSGDTNFWLIQETVMKQVRDFSK